MYIYIYIVWYYQLFCFNAEGSRSDHRGGAHGRLRVGHALDEVLEGIIMVTLLVLTITITINYYYYTLPLPLPLLLLLLLLVLLLLLLSFLEGACGGAAERADGPDGRRAGVHVRLLYMYIYIYIYIHAQHILIT